MRIMRRSRRRRIMGRGLMQLRRTYRRRVRRSRRRTYG